LFTIYEQQYLFPSGSFPVMCFVTNVKIMIFLVQTSVLVGEWGPNQRHSFEYRRVIKIFVSVNWNSKYQRSRLNMSYVNWATESYNTMQM